MASDDSLQYAIATGMQSVGRLLKYMMVFLILAYFMEMVITYVIMWDSDFALDVFNFLMKNVSRGVAPDYVSYEPKARLFYRAHPYLLRLHLIPQNVLYICGLFQLWPGSRTKANIDKHRLTGKIYAIANTLGMMGSSYLLMHVQGGYTARIGFIGMATSCLGSTYMAIWMVKAGNIQAHRQWMVRSYFTNVSSSLFFRLSWLLWGYMAKGEAWNILCWASWIVGFMCADVYLTAKDWADTVISRHEKAMKSN